PDEAVLSTLVLLERDQPRHPVHETRCRHGRAGQFGTRLHEGPTDRRHPPIPLPSAADSLTRHGSRLAAPERRGGVRTRAVAVFLCGPAEAALARPQPPDSAAAGGFADASLGNGRTTRRRLTSV